MFTDDTSILVSHYNYIEFKNVLDSVLLHISNGLGLIISL